ncbi:MAG: histidine phosphatase family protein [Pseudomonadota bacterium]
MKLILLRHAKSDWDNPLLDDRDRPLSARGIRDAPKIGAWLKRHGHYPTRILCSTATRTRETLSRLALPRTETQFRRDLYLAPATHILSLAADDAMLIIAHNPGIADAAAQAVTEPPDHPKFPAYPTGACTVVDASHGLPGPCLAFTVPRDL